MEGKSDCGFTNYKKLFSKHVHEQFFLKKHMSTIDYEMRQRDKEIFENQSHFVRKYEHVLNPLCNRTKRLSCGDIYNNEVRPKKTPNIGIRRRSFHCVSQKRRPSFIRMNSFVEPPVDFPYSYNEWHDKVEHGSYEESGFDPREVRRESLLNSLDSKSNDTESIIVKHQKNKGNRDKEKMCGDNSESSKKGKKSTSNDKFKHNKDKFDMLVKQMSEDLNNSSPRPRLPNIDIHPKKPAMSRKSSYRSSLYVDTCTSPRIDEWLSSHLQQP